MARIATKGIHHYGNSTPLRIRQSGNSLRKLIRSVAPAGFWSGGANSEKQDVANESELRAAAQRYKDRLLIDPGWTTSGALRLIGLIEAVNWYAGVKI